MRDFKTNDLDDYTQVHHKDGKIIGFKIVNRYSFNQYEFRDIRGNSRVYSIDRSDNKHRQGEIIECKGIYKENFKRLFLDRLDEYKKYGDNFHRYVVTRANQFFAKLEFDPYLKDPDYYPSMENVVTVKENIRNDSQIKLIKYTRTGPLAHYVLNLDFKKFDKEIYLFIFKCSDYSHTEEINCKFKIVNSRIKIIDLQFEHYFNLRSTFPAAYEKEYEYIDNEVIEIFKEESKNIPKLHRRLVLYVLDRYRER